MTGLATHAAVGREALQAEADNATGQWEMRRTDAEAVALGYTTNQAYPPLNSLLNPPVVPAGFYDWRVLTVTRYDDYNFDNDGAGTADAAYDPRSNGRLTAAPTATSRVVGMVTRTQTRVLGVAGGTPGAWLTSTTFYDDEARPVQVQSTNALGGWDVTTSQLSFTGQVEASVAVHHTPHQVGPDLVVVETHTYDHTGRLLTTSQQLPDEPQPVPVAALHYNEVGQLTRKTLASGALTQHVDYTYNVRGWLTQLNDAGLAEPGDLFGLELCYEQGFTPGYEQYNGNITGQKWRSRRDNTERAYGYVYDPLNRLRQGDYVARAGAAGAWTAEASNYRLSGVNYDDNGNILSLRRRGLLTNATRTAPKQFGAVDMLTYRYDGNRLQAVDDQVTTNQRPRPAGYNGAPASLAGDFQEQGVRQGQEYFYDANGNATQDRNKGITGMMYNHLNLPTQVHFGTGADSVVFRYAANGQKVGKRVYQTGQPVQRTDYVGGYQYEGDTLRFFPHAEGRVLYRVNWTTGIQYAREFTIHDHLGNLRLAYRAGQPSTATATLEADQTERETQQFDSLSVVAPVARLVGPAEARTGQWAAVLNAAGTQPAPGRYQGPTPLGPLRQLAVQKGDVVSLRAPGYYPHRAQASGFGFSLAAFVAGLLQAPPGLPGGDRGPRAAGLPWLQLGVSAGLPALLQAGGGVPKGYARLLVFDKDSNLVSQQTRQLTAAANAGYEVLAPGRHGGPGRVRARLRGQREQRRRVLRRRASNPPARPAGAGNRVRPLGAATGRAGNHHAGPQAAQPVPVQRQRNAERPRPELERLRGADVRRATRPLARIGPAGRTSTAALSLRVCFQQPVDVHGPRRDVRPTRSRLRRRLRH